MYRLIASDLDGTLLNRNHQISTHTADILTRIQQHQVHILIATGRHYRDVHRIAKDFPFPMYLITSNGARVHTSEGEKIMQRDVPPTAVDDILRLTEGCTFYRNLYHDDNWFVEADNERVLSYTNVSGFSYTRTDFAKVTRTGISKMLFIGDPDELNVLERVLVERYGTNLNITFSLPTCLEVMGQDVNKGTALQNVLERLSLTSDDVIAFGDGLNDKEMLEMAKTGVIMANADRRLKSQLPDNPQTIDNDHDGVADYLSQAFAEQLAQ
ncbi:Cof-type HAD-IIB family hydrolase [Celerinatantimonas sp. MCCC 1A17872]|uniref:Cof-type HAD-IIB family hydrolase n=1 Tax=Celerinatantimonas sp. MCCC 1A17872 TaxID=3177514 RepID=UPI0038CBD229